MNKTISTRFNDYDLERLEDIKKSSLYEDRSRKPTDSEVIRDCVLGIWMTLKELKLNKKTDENCIQQTSVHIANKKGE